jgi:thioredoxin reductase (NADPH)
MEFTVPLVIGSFAVVLLGLGALLEDRRARVRRWAEKEGDDFEAVLPLLHSINDDRCIGCEACIDVCPTEVLDLVDHKVRVSRFSDCVQCEQCATSCPTQALVMYREGTTPRMLTVPELDDHFQTAVPGQYLIGEVAGKPLVKNAANLGRAVIEHISRDLGQRPAAMDRDILDVVIVGSGPAGLSAGLTCIVRKMSYLVLEKEHIISSTVSRYPKGKHFMAEPCTAQNVSYLPVFDASKEELVAAWQQVVDGVKMPIKLGEAVDKVTRGDDGIFETKTTVGTYRSRTVVLATGLRGKPRLLAVPGANLEKVQALLDDPAEFAGQHVLVVGGGDSAVEGAMSLVDAGATVTLSYRGDGFKRCKQGNQKRLAELVAGTKMTLHLESNVKEFTDGQVAIKLKDGTLSTIANQRAFVLIGADTPVAWLEGNNVRFVERPHLYALGSTEEVVRRVVPDAAECPRDPAHAIALLRGQPLHKSPGRRALSVVDHLRDEFRDVVTSVSGAFHLAGLDDARKHRGHGHGRAPTDAHHASPAVAAKGVQIGDRIIPASRLVGRSSGPAAAVRTGRTSGAVAAVRAERPPNPFAHERTASGTEHSGLHLRPRSMNASASMPKMGNDPLTLAAVVANRTASGTPVRRASDDRATVPSHAINDREPSAPPRNLARGSAELSNRVSSALIGGPPPRPSRPSIRPSVPPPPPPRALRGGPPGASASQLAVDEDFEPTVVTNVRFR